MKKKEQKKLNLFKANMVLMSADKSFIIIPEDHNSEKGRKFFRQSENAWNDAVEEAARAGYNIVLPGFFSRPYVRYMSCKPPIKNVVELNVYKKEEKIYSVEALVNMKWTDIIDAVIEEVNKYRAIYNKKYSKQFFFVENANITINDGPTFKFRESTKTPRTFIRINKNEFDWRYSGNLIAEGNGKLEQRDDSYYLSGVYYWSPSKYRHLKSKLLAQLIPAKIQPIPLLNKKTMWQEIIFDPVPLVNEPVVGSNGEINDEVIKKEYETELACYASHM